MRLTVPQGEPIDPEDVERTLAEHPDITTVFVTHNETSTGVTNDLPAIAGVVKSRGKLLAVDSVSGAGCLPLHTDDVGIDVLVTGSQKGWMAPPGIAMIAVSAAALERAATTTSPRVYFDFAREKKYQDKQQTFTTPAVSVMYALQEGLAMMREEGLDNVWARHARVGRMIRAGVGAMGMKLLAAEGHRSDTVTAVHSPADTPEALKNLLTTLAHQARPRARGRAGHVAGQDLPHRASRLHRRRRRLRDPLAPRGRPHRHRAAHARRPCRCGCADRGTRDGRTGRARQRRVSITAELPTATGTVTRILVADPIAEDGVVRLRAAGDVDVVVGLDAAALIERIRDYDALVVRSETKVTAEVFAAAPQLRVVGRAGVGVDNIDIDAATRHGVLVLNAPTGNTIAATEHVIAMMLALARNLPAADRSLHAGLWERSKFMGIELREKTLGVLGTRQDRLRGRAHRPRGSAHAGHRSRPAGHRRARAAGRRRARRLRDAADRNRLSHRPRAADRRDARRDRRSRARRGCARAPG